jgi:3-oxoadipate enol-lactonase
LPQILLNGTSLYYEMHGSGLPIVFVHDHLSSHHMFEPQVKYFSKRAKVIVLDLRGNGQSGKMNVDIDRIIDTQCEDLKVLLERLDIPKVTLVGCSSGGVLAQKFADLYPNRVRSLVLVDSYVSAKISKSWEIFERCSWLSYYLPAVFLLRTLRLTYSRWIPAYNILREDLLNKRPTELIKQRMAVQQIEILVNPTRIQVPILCVVGSDNEWGLKHMKKVESVFPYAQIGIVDDAIYPSHLCQPQLFNRMLLDFLNDQHVVQMT